MARRDAQSWAAIVAETESGGVAHGQIALKYGVSLPALKYHLYKSRKEGAEVATRLLPVRVTGEQRTLVIEVGPARLQFSEGADPAYIAALLRAISKTC